MVGKYYQYLHTRSVGEPAWIQTTETELVADQLQKVLTLIIDFVHALYLHTCITDCIPVSQTAKRSALEKSVPQSAT